MGAAFVELFLFFLEEFFFLGDLLFINRLGSLVVNNACSM